LTAGTQPVRLCSHLKERTMHEMKYVAALALVGTFAAGAATELRAAQVLLNTTAVNSAALSLVTDVRWHHRHWHRYGRGYGRGSVCRVGGRSGPCPGINGA